MDKLQELTDKLYKQGLSKGKEEGEAIVASAKVKAGDIIDDAYKQAEAIIAKARKDSDDITAKVRSDLRLAGNQTLQEVKHDIEGLLITKMVSDSTDSVLSSENFIKEIITEVARKFDTKESQDLEIVLPESMHSSMKAFVESELGKTLGRGVDASFSRKISGGFRIGPKDGGYFISLTDETFKELISKYLRPATQKILFGE